MRTEREIEEFNALSLKQIVGGCKTCHGTGALPDCLCLSRCRRVQAAFESCVPRAFWDVKAKDVKHNVEAFEGVVLPYVEKIRLAARKGYGLLLQGDNGVGKTLFISFVLMAAVDQGLTAYYTTMPQLDYDLKRGFHDKEAADALRYALTSDVVAIDELGKERTKDSDSFTRLQIERVLKQRFDDMAPTLIATNMDADELGHVYGKTISSILHGRYKHVTLEAGDFRKHLKAKMDSDMGYLEET